MISLSAFVLIVTLTCVKYLDVTKANAYHSFQGNDVEGQIITQTMGESGELCVLYKCFSNASCINGTCVCPDGTYGDGYVACISGEQLSRIPTTGTITHDNSDDHRVKRSPAVDMPNDNSTAYVTMVLADPKLVTYRGAHAHVCLPCRILLTEIESEHFMGRKGGTCRIKVHVLNHQVGDGYFVLGTDIEVTIIDNAKPKATLESSLRIYGYGVDGVFEYKEQGKTYTTRNKYKPWQGPANLRYMDAMIHTHYDHVNNLAIVDIGECGVITVFKAHVKYTKQVPGLIVAVDQNRHVTFPQDNSPLSGSPFKIDAPTIYDKKHVLKLNKIQVLLYDALSQDTQQDFGALGISCNVASREFNSLCDTPAKKAFALRICSFLFTNTTIFSCLNADEFGETNGSMFGMCCLAMCMDNMRLCEGIKLELNMYDCGTPQGLQELDCMAIQMEREQVFPFEIFL